MYSPFNRKKLTVKLNHKQTKVDKLKPGNKCHVLQISAKTTKEFYFLYKRFIATPAPASITSPRARSNCFLDSLSQETSSLLSIIPNIPDCWVEIEMEISLSICSERNICDHFLKWPTLTGRIGPTGRNFSMRFDRPVCCTTYLQYISLMWGIGERERK